MLWPGYEDPEVRNAAVLARWVLASSPDSSRALTLGEVQDLAIRKFACGALSGLATERPDSCEVLIAISGPNSKPETWGEFSPKSTTLEDVSRCVRAEFLDQALELWDVPEFAEVWDRAKETRRIWLCGHSSGAAVLATAIELMPAETLRAIAGFYAFGCPAPFRRRTGHNKVHTVEVRHVLDPIPATPGFFRGLDSEKLWIQVDGEVTSSRPAAGVLAAGLLLALGVVAAACRRLGMKTRPPRALFRWHSIANYAEILRKKLPGGTGIIR